MCRVLSGVFTGFLAFLSFTPPAIAAGIDFQVRTYPNVRSADSSADREPGSGPFRHGRALGPARRSSASNQTPPLPGSDSPFESLGELRPLAGTNQTSCYPSKDKAIESIR